MLMQEFAPSVLLCFPEQLLEHVDALKTLGASRLLGWAVKHALHIPECH